MNTSTTNAKSINGHILSALIYFDIFKHPLMLEEIHQFAHISSTLKEVEESLTKLTNDQIIFKHKKYYSLSKDHSLIDRRIAANERSKQRMKTALRNSKYMSKLPFVRGVFLSGTIAKGVMYEDSDIDFFVITEANRLWVSKMAMKLFKLVFLLNSRRDFCYNYLLSNDKLEIEEQNLYTATELITLIPTYNFDLYQQFTSMNDWHKKYYPNCTLRNNASIVTTKQSSFQKITEKILDNTFGDWLNTTFMNYVQRKYDRKYAKELSKEERAIALRTTPHASKVHPRHYQKSFLNRFEECIKAFEAKHKLVLK